MDLKGCFEAAESAFAVQLSSMDEAVRLSDGLRANFKAPLLVFLPELQQPVWRDMTPELFPKLQKLLASSTSKAVWLSRAGDPSYNMVDGIYARSQLRVW